MIVSSRLVILAFAVGAAACEGADSGTVAVENAPPTVPGRTSFLRGPGGPVRTELGYGIVLNRASTLQREWITATDSSMPARLDGVVGVRTVYAPGGQYTSGSYQYSAKFDLVATDSITAVEVRFLVFDVWGELIRSLSSTDVTDIAPGRTTIDAKWNLFSENEASEYYASIAYVARARVRSGRVYEADRDAVVAEARKFSTQFTTEDLEPKPPATSSGGR